jgi:Cu/Ag efflux pump CusA
MPTNFLHALRPASFIDTALHNIRSSLIIGAILVIAVLLLFLFNFRTAAISFTAIPVSLLVAVIVLNRLGYTLNVMTLGGLAIAIGEVVDDAVIDVENILRRLRENRHSENPRPASRVVNLPMALIGGIFAVFITGRVLSLGALVAFVTLFGITLRNSIMMISHFEHLVAVEGMAWGPEAALRGASERLAPILMTAMVTGLGLLPLALGSGAPGREIDGPMAIVILGGLFTSTALNLLVLPTLALRYGRFERVAQQI